MYAARPAAVRLQDYGTIPLEYVDYAPETGYSELGRAELIEGHSYIVRIVTEVPYTFVNYAKFHFYGIGYDAGGVYVDLDWAYQIDEYNRELKVQAGRDSGGARDDEIVRF